MEKKKFVPRKAFAKIQQKNRNSSKNSFVSGYFTLLWIILKMN